jgi:hypothetical protein
VRMRCHATHTAVQALTRRGARPHARSHLMKQFVAAEDQSALRSMLAAALASSDGSRGGAAQIRHAREDNTYLTVHARLCFDGEFLYAVMLDATVPARVEESLRDFLLSTSAWRLLWPVRSLRAPPCALVACAALRARTARRARALRALRQIARAHLAHLAAAAGGVHSQRARIARAPEPPTASSDLRPRDRARPTGHDLVRARQLMRMAADSLAVDAALPDVSASLSLRAAHAVL